MGSGKLRKLTTPVLTAILAAPLLASSGRAADSSASIPDFSGRWGRNAFNFEPLPSGPRPLTNMKRRSDGTGDPNQLVGDYTNPILKPEAAAVVKAKGEISRQGLDYPDPSNNCSPYPPPFIFAMQLAFSLFQQKDHITLVYNQDDQVRFARLNAAHPANLKPTWKGDSVAHYEGNTLVIDTVGIKTGPLNYIDRYGTPHTDALHVVERYRLIDGEAAKQAAERHEKEDGLVGAMGGGVILDPGYKGKGLQVALTVEDPGVFTTPWSATITYRRVGEEWREQVCAENTHEYYAGRTTAIPTADKPDF